MRIDIFPELPERNGNKNDRVLVSDADLAFNQFGKLTFDFIRDSNLQRRFLLLHRIFQNGVILIQELLGVKSCIQVAHVFEARPPHYLGFSKVVCDTD